MGHATHFLSRLERLSTAEVELALGLYRDAPLVREVLARSSLPEDTERAAIGLGGDDGPWIVVSRDGGFVTCLGQGMSTGSLPIVPRERLLSVSRRIERFKQQLDAAERLGTDQRKGKQLFSRLLAAGPTLTGTEISTLEQLAPLMQPELLSIFKEMIHGIGKRRMSLARSERHHLRQNGDLIAYRRDGWTLGHLSLLLLPSFRKTTTQADVDAEFMIFLPMQTWASGLWATAARGLWVTSMLGKPLVPALKQHLRSNEWMYFVPALTALVAIGVRHPKLTAEIRKVFDKSPANIPIKKLRDDNPVRPDLFSLARMVLEAPENSRFLLESEWCEELPGLSSDPSTLPSLDDLWSRAFGAVHPLFKPPAVALQILTAGWVGREPLQELYPTADEAAGIEIQEDPEEIWNSLGSWRGRLHSTGFRRSEKTGRNEPCPCGGGRKFKHCCGG